MLRNFFIISDMQTMNKPQQEIIKLSAPGRISYFVLPSIEIDENAVNVFLWSQLIIKYQIQTIMSLLLYCHWNDDWHTNKILETKLTWIYIFLEFPCFSLNKTKRLLDAIIKSRASRIWLFDKGLLIKGYLTIKFLTNLSLKDSIY